MNKIKFWQSMSPFGTDDWNLNFDELGIFQFEENKIDLYETEDFIFVEIKCAGFKPEDLRVTLEDNILTIKGDFKKEVSEKEENKQYHKKEIIRNSFSRTITLPTHVKEENIETLFKNGILKITMPKLKEKKTKQIQINVN